jgi:hypothetical protein
MSRLCMGQMLEELGRECMDNRDAKERSTDYF